MTVRKQAQGFVDCEWFNGHDLKSWDFKEEQIQIALPKPDEE